MYFAAYLYARSYQLCSGGKVTYKDGFVPPEGSDMLLKQFFGLISDYNNKVNLTAITGERQFFIKHVWDSLAGQKYFPAGASVAEVGSGGGFPSLPLKICRPDLFFTLFESVGKKCAFLKLAADSLALEGVEVVNCRAEDAGKNGKFREKYDVCCARAVARLNTLLEYCAPLVKVGGRVVAYKGDAAEEIEEAANAAKLLGLELECAEHYDLPEGEGARTLAVYRKIKPTPPKFPRGQGKERKDPL